MERTKGVSLAKGPVGIIGIVLLAGGILGLLIGSTDFTMNAPNGDVVGRHVPRHRGQRLDVAAVRGRRRCCC